MIYLPHFLSWIVLGGILLDILSAGGILNRAIKSIGFESQLFIGSNQWFRGTIITSGFLEKCRFLDHRLSCGSNRNQPDPARSRLRSTAPGAFVASGTSHCPASARRWCCWPALSLGDVLQAGFEQILTLYSPAVYRTGDIIDTYVFRRGLVSAQYSLAGAVGLFKSFIGFFLIVLSYRLAESLRRLSHFVEVET